MKEKRAIGYLSLILIVSFMLTACAGSAPTPPNPTSERSMGTLTGKILRADGKPLVNVMRGDTGYVILMCPEESSPRGECLAKQDNQKNVSEIIASICEIGQRSGNCKLHYMMGASRIVANGSYIFPAVFPGKYDLYLIVVSSGIAMAVQLINVEPVEAGKTVEYNFRTQ